MMPPTELPVSGHLTTDTADILQIVERMLRRGGDNASLNLSGYAGMQCIRISTCSRSTVAIVDEKDQPLPPGTLG